MTPDELRDLSLALREGDLPEAPEERVKLALGLLRTVQNLIDTEHVPSAQVARIGAWNAINWLAWENAHA
jgi:hypothetical protein